MMRLESKDSPLFETLSAFLNKRLLIDNMYYSMSNGEQIDIPREVTEVHGDSLYLSGTHLCLEPLYIFPIT
jgi:predicted secreted protein